MFIKTVMLLLWSLALAVGDDTITCFFSKECVLPCRSTYYDIIHWLNGDINVHSFYKGTDQLGHQNEAYKGRTALFTDQISKGNTSLILSRVKIQDRGKYKCYTAISSDSKEAFVNVNVMAPVQSVDIEMTNNEITCTVTKVYPKPTILWNIEGEKNLEEKEDSQGLIDFTSTLKIQPIQSNATYTCSVSSGDGTHKYSASLAEVKAEIDSGKDIMIHCPESQGDPGHFIVTLMFNNSSEVLRYDSKRSLPINEHWKGTNIKITHEGSITLHNVESAKHAGIYTCERMTAHSKQKIETLVQIKSDGNYIVIIVVGIVVVAIACILALVLYKTNKIPKCKRNNSVV